MGQGGFIAGLCFVLGVTAFAAEGDEAGIDAKLVDSCDLGVTLSASERMKLLQALRISKAGQKTLTTFLTQYHSLKNLILQWDTVSYSQIAGNATRRAPASNAAQGALGGGICVHLAKDLPEIEHVADLAHELTHATRLSRNVLKGEVATAEEFVRQRLAARGGEADAFSVECQVKRELLGHWDPFCAPYVTRNMKDGGERMDPSLVLRDFYNGQLSASLTGEPYPRMLARQFHALRHKFSALENKRATQ